MSEVNERTPLNQGSSLKEFYFTDRKYSHVRFFYFLVY